MLDTERYWQEEWAARVLRWACLLYTSPSPRDCS